MFSGGAGPGGAAGRRAGAETGGGFRDIFSQFFGHGGAQPEHEEPDKGGDLEYAMDIDFWQAINGMQARLGITRYEVCDTCHGSGSAGGGEIACPECKGTGHVTQMAGAMRFNINCPRCGGSGQLRNACPTCGGRRAHRPPGDGGGPHPSRRAQRLPPARARQGQRRIARRRAGRPLHHHQGGRTPFFHRDGDNIEIKVPVAVWEAALGSKI